MSNREIKFRALAPLRSTKKLHWFEDVFYDGNEVIIDSKHMDLQRLKNVKAIVQYTGRKDKNGVEIYEGDLLSVDDGNRIAKVVWFNIGACYDTEVIKVNNRTASFISLNCKQFNCRTEIIGNIYENPELLDG